MSKQRKVIYKVIEQSCEHLTAIEIYDRAKIEIPNISMGTVYRNLGQMVDERKLLRVVPANGPDRFDKNVNIHGHLICDKCGSVEDFSCNDLAKNIVEKYNIEPVSYQLSIYYVCDKCREAADE